MDKNRKRKEAEALLRTKTFKKRWAYGNPFDNSAYWDTLCTAKLQALAAESIAESSFDSRTYQHVFPLDGQTEFAVLNVKSWTKAYNDLLKKGLKGLQHHPEFETIKCESSAIHNFLGLWCFILQEQLLRWDKMTIYVDASDEEDPNAWYKVPLRGMKKALRDPSFQNFKSLYHGTLWQFLINILRDKCLALQQNEARSAGCELRRGARTYGAPLRHAQWYATPCQIHGLQGKWQFVLEVDFFNSKRSGTNQWCTTAPNSTEVKALLFRQANPKLEAKDFIGTPIRAFPVWDPPDVGLRLASKLGRR